MSTDLWGAWAEVVAESACTRGSGFCVVRWNVDAGGQQVPARRCFPLSGVRRQRRSVSLWKSDTACVRKKFVQTPAKFRGLKWFTYSRGWGKLLGKALHLCRVDLVVKVNEIAPLLLTRSWIMCWWCVGGQEAVAVVSIICNQQCDKCSLLTVELQYIVSSYITDIMRATYCELLR